MVLIIGKGSIEEKIKKEKHLRKIVSKEEDIRAGKCSAKGPTRGDFKFCDEGSKFLQAMKKYPKEKDKISKEYDQMMKEGRKYG